MLGLGFAEVMVLALLSGGVTDTDLVALVQPTHYFKTRQIEITIDRAVEYASDDPKDAKTQIVQLTSLRYLTDEAEALKKSPKYPAHRQVIEQIAAGKKAQDPTGFAQDYAKRLLLKLDNAKPDPAKARLVKDDALSWFPANVSLAGALDLEQVRQAGPSNAIRDLLKLIPDREKTQMYEFIEKAGNVRLERIAFAYADGAGQGQRDGKIYMRMTGKGNQNWIVEAIKTVDGGRGRLQTTVSKDKDGTPITTMQEPNSPPVIMLVGNTDLLVVGHERRGKDNDLVDQVLDARSKKKPNAAAGPLKDQLAKVPGKAVAFMVGNPPENLKRELGFVFNPVPSNVTAFVERAQQGLDVQVSTNMANRDDADRIVQKVASLKKDGVAALEQQMKQPPQPGFPPIPYQSMINLLDSLQVQSKGEHVQTRVVVPDGLIQQMTSTFMMFGLGHKLPDPPKCD